MLKLRTPFPLAGSYALHETAGETHLVRIIELPEPELALIAYPLRSGASGNTRVHVGDLLDGDPLSAADRAELVTLERKLAGAKRPKRADLDREEDLRQRDIRSGIVRDLIEQGIRRKLIGADAGKQALAA